MRWPRWIPYPVNWIRSGMSLFFVAILFYSVIIFGFMTLVFSAPINHPGRAAIALFIGLLIPIFFLAIVHKSIFRRNVPGWFPRWSSWYEGTAIIVGSVLCFLAMMPFAVASCASTYQRYYSDCDISREHWAWITTIGFVFGAYFFQVEYLIRQAIGNRRKPSPAQVPQAPPQTTAAPAPRLEPPPKFQGKTLLSELERLKRELGR